MDDFAFLLPLLYNWDKDVAQVEEKCLKNRWKGARRKKNKKIEKKMKKSVDKRKPI